MTTRANLAASQRTFPVLLLACLAAVTEALPENPTANLETGFRADKFRPPSRSKRMTHFAQPSHDDTEDKLSSFPGSPQNNEFESESGKQLDDDDLDKNLVNNLVHGKFAYPRHKFVRIGRDDSSLADLPSDAAETNERASQFMRFGRVSPGVFRPEKPELADTETDN